MDLSLKLFFTEFNRKLDELEARWERRSSPPTKETRVTAKEHPGVVGLMHATAQHVVADNWGGEFEEAACATEKRVHEQRPAAVKLLDEAPRWILAAQLMAEVVPDNWGGLFERPAHISELALSAFDDNVIVPGLASTGQIRIDSASPPSMKEQQDVVVASDNWGGLFEQSDHTLEERDLNLPADVEATEYSSVCVELIPSEPSEEEVLGGPSRSTLLPLSSPICSGPLRVSTTAHLSDLAVVDAATGVCVQINAALRQVFVERVRPCLAPSSTTSTGPALRDPCAEDDGADDPVDPGPKSASQTNFRICGGAEVADLFRKLDLNGAEDIAIYFGFQLPDSGVALKYFLHGGILHRFKHGVPAAGFLPKLRGGTCSTVCLDPSDAAVRRAICVRDDVLLAASEALAEQATKEHFGKVYELVLASCLPHPDDFVKDAESCLCKPTNCSTQVLNSSNDYRTNRMLHHTNGVLIPDIAGFMVVEFQSVIGSTWASPYCLSPHTSVWLVFQDVAEHIQPRYFTANLTHTYSVDGGAVRLCSATNDTHAVQRIFEGMFAQTLVQLRQSWPPPMQFEEQAISVPIWRMINALDSCDTHSLSLSWKCFSEVKQTVGFRWWKRQGVHGDGITVCMAFHGSLTLGFTADEKTIQYIIIPTPHLMKLEAEATWLVCIDSQKLLWGPADYTLCFGDSVHCLPTKWGDHHKLNDIIAVYKFNKSGMLLYQFSTTIQAPTASAMWLLHAINYLAHEEFQFSFEIANMTGTTVVLLLHIFTMQGPGNLIGFQEVLIWAWGGCISIFLAPIHLFRSVLWDPGGSQLLLSVNMVSYALIQEQVQWKCGGNCPCFFLAVTGPKFPVARSYTKCKVFCWELILLDMGFLNTNKEVIYNADCLSSTCFKQDFSQFPWDPGGTMHRLGGKPIFKVGRMSGTTYGWASIWAMGLGLIEQLPVGLMSVNYKRAQAQQEGASNKSS